MSICGGETSGTMNCRNKNYCLRADLAETLNELEKRHCTLANRRHCLTEKILNMEKTMPLLVAHKLLNSRDDDFSLKKIRELVDKLSPYPHPNPTEKLLKQTEDKLHNLTKETKQLHEKIIEIDVKLEESGMELDSLLSVNSELNDKIKSIESQAHERSRRPRTLPDLQDIDPEDLVCIGKLRQLIQQEIRFKNCIKALENRESRLYTQLNQLASINEMKNNDKSNKKEQRRRKKQKSRRSDERFTAAKKNHSKHDDGICHCGSEISLDEDNYLTDVDSPCTDDESSNDEYWECCNCEY